MLRSIESAAAKRMAATCFAWALAMSAGSAFAADAGDNATWKDGKHVYDKVCGYCHDDGRVGPELLGRQLPAAYAAAIVRHGFRAMPAFPASYIDDASLQKVGEFIATAPAPKK
ncbi:MAG: cytochrome c [Spongiibacteraceae bacterium]|jgi:mono/diheme cytochrome c family protein|nr:cytochrome c [Spongiibacteraceae bacterium]